MKTTIIVSLLTVTGLVSAAPATNVPTSEVIARKLPVGGDLPTDQIVDNLPLGQVLGGIGRRQTFRQEVKDEGGSTRRGLPLVSDLPLGQVLGGIGRRQELELELASETGESISSRGLPLVDSLPLGQVLGGIGRRHNPHERHEHPEHHRGNDLVREKGSECNSEV